MPHTAIKIGLLASCAIISATNAAIVNGDFENGTAGWRTQRPAGQGCDDPARVGGANPAAGGRKVGRLHGGTDGCESAVLYQTFDCSGSGSFCTVTFQASFPPSGDPADQAFVNLGGVSKKIPPNGAWQSYMISAAGCTNSITIAFTLVGFGFPTNPLQIDNVTSQCTATNMTSAALINETTTFTSNANDPAFANLHDVPNLSEGPIDNHCGPTAAGSCIAWWKENGYPDIKTRSGGTTPEDMRDQLASDAKTDANTGTDLGELAKAMNRMIDEGPNNQPGAHKGQLKAKGTLQPSDLRNFNFLDSEFQHGEDILMLITYVVNGVKQNHFVTVRKVTGTGNMRTVSYMDPETGSVKSTTLTMQNNKLETTYEGHSGYVSGFITMSPAVAVASTVEPVNPANPNGPKKIKYKVHYPHPTDYPDKLVKDLHVEVKDCTQANYQVTGLPAGWQWQVAMAADGKCYLTFWKGGSAMDLPSGSEITVTYSGPNPVQEREQIITPTTSGASNPATGPLPKLPGHAVVSLTGTAPEQVSQPRVMILESPPESLGTVLAWDPSPDPFVNGYAIFSNYTDQQIGFTNDPFFVTTGLSADTPYSLSVFPVRLDGTHGAPSEPIFFHRDELSGLQIAPGGIQTLVFPPPLSSYHLDNQWQVTIPGAASNGSLIVHTVSAMPEPPHPTPAFLQGTFWHLSSTASVLAGPVSVTIPYSETRVYGPEELLQVHHLNAGVWTNVTSSVDTDLNLIHATLPQMGTVLIVNASPPVPAMSSWAMVTAALCLLILGTVVVSTRNRRSHSS